MASNDVVMRVRAEDKTSGTFDKIAGKAKGLGGVLGGALRGGAIAGAAAIAGLGVASVKMALDFEKSFGEVKTLLPDISEKAFGKLKDDVIAFSKEMGISTDKAIPALYQAISAGVPPDNVMTFMETAAKASIGGVTDLETAVDGITSVVNAYGDEVVDAAAASDIMFTAVRLGKTDFGQLSSALFNVIPTAASLGISFEDVSAQLANLTAQGTPTSVATTQIRAAMVEASKGGTKLDLAIKKLTGESFAELIKQGETMPEIMNALRDSMPEQAFKDLFGSVEAMNAVLGTTGTQFENTQSAMAEMQDAAGASTAAFDTMSETTSFKLNKAINLLKVTLLEVGLQILPLLADALAVVVPWLEENMPKAIETLKGAFQSIKPAIDSFIKGLGILFPIVQDIVKFIVDNKPVLIAALAAIGIAIVLAFGPVAVGTIAIIAFIALLPQLPAAFQMAKEAVVGVANDIASFFNTWKTEIIGIMLLLFTGPGGLIFLFATNSFGIRDKVIEIFGDLIDFFKGLPGKIINVLVNRFKNVVATFVQFGRDLIQGLIDGALSMFPSLGDMAMGVVNTVKDTITSGFGLFSPSRVMAGFGKDTIAGLLLGMESKKDELEASIMAITEVMSRTFEKGILGSLSAGRDDLLQQLRDLMKEAREVAFGVGSSIVEGIEDELQKLPPVMTWFTNQVTDAVEGLAASVKAGESSKVLTWFRNQWADAFDGIAASLADKVPAMADRLQWFRDQAWDAFDGIAAAIESGAGASVDTLTWFRNQMSDAFAGLIDSASDPAIIAAFNALKENIIGTFEDIAGAVGDAGGGDGASPPTHPIVDGSGNDADVLAALGAKAMAVLTNDMRGTLFHTMGSAGIGMTWFEIIQRLNERAEIVGPDAMKQLFAERSGGPSLLAKLRSFTGLLDFASGGIVPGPIGAPVLATVHGGERITPAGANGITINISAIDGESVRRMIPEIARELNFQLRGSGLPGLIV